jgi:hypothetical protein
MSASEPRDAGLFENPPPPSVSPRIYRRRSRAGQESIEPNVIDLMREAMRTVLAERAVETIDDSK